MLARTSWFLIALEFSVRHVVSIRTLMYLHLYVFFEHPITKRTTHQRDQKK